jgi:hypothetical protein
VRLKVGQTLKSAVDATTVIVVRAPGSQIVVTCGGVPMYDAKSGEASGAPADPARMDGSLLGKRYVDESDTLEILCTKGGEGTLGLDGVPLTIKAAKPLPASD